MSTDSRTKKRLVELSAGVYVERDVLSIAERVKEYDENLSIKFCEPSLANPTDAPYKLVERCKDGVERVVFDIWELNASILDRLYDADTQKNNILLSIDGKNLIAQKAQQRRYEEHLELAHDVTVSMLKSNKHKWTYKDNLTGKTITFDDRVDGYYKVKA